MSFKNITVAGSGVLGSQIAYQTAYKGFTVSVYDVNDEAIGKAKERYQKWMQRYQEDLDATKEETQQAYERITFYTDLKEATKDADLVIEAVPERTDIKIDFYHKLAEVAPEKTVFVTNSSTLLPSDFAEATGRPEKFLALHFANEIWINNTAEVMKHEKTNMDHFYQVVEFAKEIGMVPLELHKEQPGYILNSLLVPFLNSGLSLLVNEVSDVETIDKTWMIATGSPRGPMGILDIIGMTTPYNINAYKGQNGDENAKKIAQYLKENYIDQGKMGISSGEGFYSYPNPSYQDPDFLNK
ncbi:3-hydroxyacyl-CoA dehydrogenase [Allobacillus sp. GCM10007491]|uniref:3-hydroxyacyl-CoA dehydrogenase n=1 Tax=Allobacillus saliphilus TaxID=2912308 RepID=A0A941HTM4_9BACI|nr:3-hydroxyacyl-CoA dehydrogenase [Allobacillus saliphilus]MBR7554996.1 3-hydroxyacyl-CoA dehydrogenase [Allobacillus saliphilus]